MDSVFFIKKNQCKEIGFSSVRIKAEEPGSILFSRGVKTRNFFTNDSGLYFDSSKKSDRKYREKFFDSLNYRDEEIVNKYRNIRSNNNDILYKYYQELKRKIEKQKSGVSAKSRLWVESISLIRLWNTSMVVAVLVGMISMTAIYRYLGQGVSADIINTPDITTEQVEEKENEWDKEKENEYINEIAGYLEDKDKNKFNKTAEKMVKDYPIENMMKYILGKDRDVAAFVIAIAKKESNWGKRVPVLNGKDCYNYWGYRGKRKRMGTGGHTCFDSRKDAVDTIAKRIKVLMEKYDRDTPKEMVVWKCGSNCAATGGQAAANKWISDVDMYIKKLNNAK